MKRFLVFLSLATATLAAELPLVERPVVHFRCEKLPLAAALRVLGRTTGTVILVDPDASGEVTVEVEEGTLGTALDALTTPLGLYYEQAGEGLRVRRMKTVLYVIDYPQLSRSGSGSASITLGGASGSGTTGFNGTSPVAPSLTANGLPQQTGSDATQVSIQQDNPNTFWTGLESELKAILGEGDRLVLNRFAGVAQVTAPWPRHEALRAFLSKVNRRITAQVEIEARLVEVQLRDEQQLGVDWDLATASLGKDITVQAQSPLPVTGVGGVTLGANTFTATLGLGRASALVQALRQQGDVKTVAQPRLRALNNQTSFIKAGQDQPFFRLQQSTTFQQAGTTTPVNQTQEQYAVSTITIGTILAVTPQVDDAGVITLDVLPAITRLQAIVTSPDGKQTAPLTDVKQASTIVRLRDGETAVIGGLLSEESGTTDRSVPGLGAVPLVGRAFRSQAKLRTRSELVILLTPRLIRR